MPTFTAIALDRLIEAGTQKTMAGYKGSDQRIDRNNSSTTSTFDRGTNVPRTKLEKAVSVPNGKLEQRNGTSAVTIDRKHHWTQISPALYATPEPTPLPDSPSSFPPSPYIINHKRRGPRLLKSFSEDDVAIRNRASNEEKLDSIKDADNEIQGASNGSIVHPEEGSGESTTIRGPVWDKSFDAEADVELGINEFSNALAAENGPSKSVTSTHQRQKDCEVDDFFDPQESMSVKSNAESETNTGDRSLYAATPLAEFYDAWEELSSENGPQPPVPDIEAELREVRLSLMMEIEKRKQAEESLQSTKAQWQKIREELSIVGLTVPADLVAIVKDEKNEYAEDFSLQMEIVRFVSNSIGRGTAKAEVEAEMEVQMELKNFEIARLLDRLHYYEAVNREMSQRNQETIESSRRLRQIKKRRQRWIWGSVATAVTLGAAVLAWSYFPGGKGLPSSSLSHPSEGDSKPSH